MKIAFIIHMFPRLHNTFILNEIVELIKRGHKVSIFSLNRTNENIINENVMKYKLIENTYYFDNFVGIKKPILNWVKDLLKKDNKNLLIKDYFQYFKPKLTYNTVVYCCSGCKNRIYLPVVLLKKLKLLLANGLGVLSDELLFKRGVYAFEPIATVIKREKFDIIHAGLGNNPATSAMILSELTKIPFTFECHAYDLFVDLPFAKEKILKASKIFTISDYNKRYLIDNYSCPARKIIVKRITFNKRYCDNIEDIPKKDDLIVSVCRLHPTKGLEYAIEAFNLILKKRKELKYIIIGDGPLRGILKRKVEKLGLNKNIIFLGDIKNTEALRYLKEAIISLLPSIIAPNGDRDGIPTSLVEAMYLETPVISSRVSGIPELINDNINGFLTEPKNVEQIAERIDFLLSNRDIRYEMGKKAKDKINKMFDIESNINKLLEGFKIRKGLHA